MKYKIIIYLVLISSYAAADVYIINTSSGISHGYFKNNVISWDDIPYAKPPIGDLRWKAPQEILDPKNIITPKDNNFCVQKPSGMGGSSGDGFFSGTEDCLYLDIKAPKNKSYKLLPVMFWIHGGGNTSGLKDLYDYSKMVKRHNVIVVSINYRLGPFGWFTHPSIQDSQSGLDKTSNFGTLDIIEALKWVQSNISLFGGDPENITVFGESAGGHNVFSLLVSKQAKGLFHKAISQSGYTTTINTDKAYKQDNYSSTSNHSSFNVVDRILKNKGIGVSQLNLPKDKVRSILLDLSAEDFFSYYAKRPSYEEIPLLTSDGVVIPLVGLNEALKSKEHVNIVPTIAGSNRDEVKLWLASAKYFAELKYSTIGRFLNIPKIKINNPDSFEIFNKYRSAAWKIRGVDEPLRNLYEAGNNNLFAYRYDWDDHRRFVVADFKKLIGAAHATEIPLLTGDKKLTKGYGFLLYPAGISKNFLSKNMMSFWANFAKNGNPGHSTNLKEWLPYNNLENNKSNFIILDNKANLKMATDTNSYESLAINLHKESEVSNLEKCVILLQMYTFVGNDIYKKYINNYPGDCNRIDSENFLKTNSSFIEY
jgi:para-nitrobenzyl esterase